MTFSEMLQQYLDNGGRPYNYGVLPSANAGGFSDASLQSANDANLAGQSRVTLQDGSTAYYGQDGNLYVESPNGTDGYTRNVFLPDGTLAGSDYIATPDLSAGRSLANAALTLGGTALGANLLVPALSGAGAPSAAAAGTGAGSGIAGAIDGMMAGSIPTAAMTPGIDIAALSTPAGLDTAVATGGGAAGVPAMGAATTGAFGANAASTAGSALSGGASAASSIIPRLSDGSIDWGNLLTNPALLAAGAGAVAGVAGNSDMKNSSTTTGNAATIGSSNTSASQGLAPWLQGYAQDYVSRAQQLANAPSSNAAMDTSRGLLTNLATQGDPLVNAAQQQQANVIGGGLLNSNPYIDAVAQNIGNRMGDAYAVGTRANTATRFNADGNSPMAKSAYGQTQFMNDRAFADSVGSTMSNLYAGNYAQERAAQDAASRGSLAFGQFGANNAQNLYGLGSQDWMRPFQQNQFFGQSINPAFGSQSTGMANTAQNVNSNQTQSQTISAPNNWMAGLGGAAMGAGIYNMFNPMRRTA